MIGSVRTSWGCWWVALLLAAAGCTRTHYRLDADHETYCILGEKTAQTPWRPPAGFTIEPEVGSRLFDPSPTDDPQLPIPAPRLYAYQLPEVPPRDPERFGGSLLGPASRVQGVAGGGESGPAEAPEVFDTLADFVSYEEPMPQLVPDGPPESSEAASSDAEEPEARVRLAPIPQTAWDSLPSGCLMRMFEFESVREEYHRTTGHDPSADQLDPSPRLALEDILDLTLLNSREYQTQKESLYRVALRLSLERYDYLLKFATSGNGTAANYRHNRNQGVTSNSLGIPTSISGDKLLATGGDLLARFANDVVLTFNGPDGFAADVGSELLMEVYQSVFQRDVAFEGLTQAERDVVYQARDFARYRKQLFRDMARDYYSLILTYRGIEIDVQDYFSNLRAFNQGEAEYRAGRRSRVEVDQVEQQALSSRSSLIRSCNSLEESLDRLKIRVGLPPELAINLDLTELENLTLRDELTVSGELVRRARRVLILERGEPSPDRSVLLNGAIDLTRRMLNLSEFRTRLGEEGLDVGALEILLARLSADEARLLVRFNRDMLARELQADPPAPPIRIFQRTMDPVDSLLTLVEEQLDLAERLSADPAAIDELGRRRNVLTARYEQVRTELEQAVADRQLDRIPELILSAEALLADAEAVAASADRLTEAVERTSEEELQETLRQVDRLVAESGQLLGDESIGLMPVEIEMDEAMLTALVQRFDLMNERGALADTWRSIKLAGDDLRSVLNLSASQSVRTRSDLNRPFDFTFDDSQTRLSLSLDTPFNRKSQRNAFRQSLISYEAGLRNLMQSEDDIKLSIRDDLRQLQLDREQYQIAVASAALAYERVVSTRLQLRLGIADVDARDFLESQQAYTASLIQVAGQHIGYLTDRIQLFLDLELLEVDDNGFWPELYNEQFQPAADTQWPPYACRPYGELPGGVWHSCKMRRMLEVPAGTPTAETGQLTLSPDNGRGLEAIPAPLPEEIIAPLPELIGPPPFEDD